MSKTYQMFAAAVVATAGTAAMATPTLQFDVNGFGYQAHNGAGANSPFGGLNHTGSVAFSVSTGLLAGVFIQTTPNGAFTNQNFSGATMTGFSGQITLTNGQVTGGSITLTISNGDSYTCGISPNSGFVTTYIGGGFKIEALTRNGFFNDAAFSNVNVSPWFNAQGIVGLPGSFLQFNFNPNAQGAGNADMDLFVDVVPLPPAAWTGLATLAGAMTLGYVRRKRA